MIAFAICQTVSACSQGSIVCTSLQDNADPQQWRALVDDVWEVVDNNFMDARSAGFDRERWRQLRDDVLSKPLASRAAAHGQVPPWYLCANPLH